MCYIYKLKVYHKIDVFELHFVPSRTKEQVIKLLGGAMCFPRVSKMFSFM